jgi:exodeoxyribonuclease VIII
LTHEEYLKIDAVSASFLKECVLNSLAHAKAKFEIPFEESDAMFLGSAVHARVFEPDVYASKFAPDRKLKGDNATAEKRRMDIEGMYASICAHTEARRLLMSEGGKNETPILWTEQKMPARAKLDRRFGSAVIDLKTCSDASPRGFSRAVFSQWRYDIQAAWYLRAARENKMEVDRFIFVAVENKRPWPVCVYQMDQAAIDYADEEIDLLLPRIKAARDSGNWPAYPTGVQTLYLPAWMAGGAE